MGSPRFLRPTLAIVALHFLWGLASSSAPAHDIPNARIDRSMQVTIRPGRILVDYSIGLSELTLARDFKELGGEIREGGPKALFERYGELAGPLNARGILLEVDGRPIELKVESFDLEVQEHPQYLFHLGADLPSQGRLSLQDTNYLSSEGAVRLAARALRGMRIEGYDGPADLDAVEDTAEWRLTPEQSRSRRRLAFTFGPDQGTLAKPGAPRTGRAQRELPVESAPTLAPRPPRSKLSDLLSRASGSWWLLLLVFGFATALGAAHSLQPGHGKAIVSAASLGSSLGWKDALVLATTTTLTHGLLVLVVAVGLWTSRSTTYAPWDNGLRTAAGLVLGFTGCWRLGRALRGADAEAGHGHPVRAGSPWLVGLGAGLVPCWDAVILIVLAEAAGQLPVGLLLLLGFSLGMAAVLVVVSLATRRMERWGEGRFDSGWLASRLGAASGALLAGMGLGLFWR